MDLATDAILNIWQPSCARPLTVDDAHEIAGNLYGFFEVLNAWSEFDAAEQAIARDAHGRSP